MNDERNLGEKTDDSGQQPRYEHYQFHEEQRTVLKSETTLHPHPVHTVPEYEASCSHTAYLSPSEP